MAAAKHNLVIEQGVDFVLEVTLTDSSGAAINVSDDTFTSRIRRSPETDAIQLSNTPIDFTPSGQNSLGEVTFKLTAAETAALPGDNLIYDIFRTDELGNITRDLEGEIEVIERVTYS
jgi:hypothetical protein